VDLFGPGPNYRAPIRTPYIPPTHSSAQLSTAVCGDIRDAIITEYTTYKTGFQPQCNYFTQHGSSFYFSFAQYNYPGPVTKIPLYPYAILTLQLFSFADAFQSRTAFSINSGYRCPSQNANLTPVAGAKTSQHMFGTAIDAGNPSHSSATWNLMYDAAFAAGADWSEPQSGPCKLGCVHGDVRDHPHTYVFP
jgi:Peptidase M15